MTGRDELCENRNPLQGLTFNGPTLLNEEPCAPNRTESEC